MHKGNRRSIRLPHYDYSQPGAYFVTICVHEKEHRLGGVADGAMHLNPLGRIAFDAWRWLEAKFPIASIPVLCVMPNHLHAIIALELDDGRGVLQHAPTRASGRKKPLGGLIGAYKTHTTVLINQVQNTPGLRFWQRNYYERAIRNQREFDAVAEYIQANPLNWEQDDIGKNF